MSRDEPQGGPEAEECLAGHAPAERWTRRELLRTTLGAAAACALPPGLLGTAPGDPRSRSRLEPASSSAPGSPRRRLLLDFGWRFALGHADDPARDFGYGRKSAFAKAGTLFEPSKPDFDAAAWRELDLPHDWAVELPFVNDPELRDSGFRPLGRRWPDTSIGWYRREIRLPEALARGRRLALEFDGVFRNAIVAFNGHFLAGNMSGYAPFRVDLTDVFDPAAPNILVVRVDATEHEGWFYEGAGIYRHVWLVETGPVHVAPDGVFVHSAVEGDDARLTIATELANDAGETADCRVTHTVLDAAGNTVATTAAEPASLPACTGLTLTQEALVARPALWSPDSPALYRLVTTVEGVDGVLDRVETTFGMRTIRFDAERGFFLNGRRLELRGTCNHQDHAGVGAAVPDRLQAYRIERLKAMGSNAYRAAHNPPARELLDACDRLGMLVVDETRMFEPGAEGLSQLERMVRRDRNHPSVFCWSIANEEQADQWNERGARIAATLKRAVLRLDPGRPVAAAMDSGFGTGISTVIDVQGFNYRDAKTDAFHQRFPAKPCMGTEVASALSTRGIYTTDKERGYLSAYDVNHPWWGSTAEDWWAHYAAREYLAGGFVWTGLDYRGEPTPYDWPCVSSHFGVMDTCGFPKDAFFYYQAMWGGAPVLHLFPHWSWQGREGQPIDVWCYTNLDRVELLLNGRSLGARDVPRYGHVQWTVPYAPGTLTARGYRTGSRKPALIARRETTGAPARLALRPDRARIAADGQDVAVVEVRVEDARGRLVPVAGDEVAFRVTGAGKLLGVGNGDPSSHEADRAMKRSAFGGLCCAILQAGREPGTLTLEAGAPGLAGAKTAIACEPAQRPMTDGV